MELSLLKNRRLNHTRRFVGYPQAISKRNIKPGMIVTFSYVGYHNDPKPLILFLGVEEKRGGTRDDLLHGINLNYLHEANVQKLFTELSKKTPVRFDDQSFKEWGSSFGYVEIEKDINSPGNNANVIYETVIKPKLMRAAYTKNCYRTYFFNKVQSLKLVNYKLDAIEKAVREQTGLSKHALKTPELFKQLEEDQLDVSADNRQTLSQHEVRSQAMKDYLDLNKE